MKPTPCIWILIAALTAGPGLHALAQDAAPAPGVAVEAEAVPEAVEAVEGAEPEVIIEVVPEGAEPVPAAPQAAEAIPDAAAPEAEADEPAPDVAAPVVAPLFAPRANAEPSGGVALADGRITLNFSDAPLPAVLAFLSEASGLVVVGDVQVEGRVNMISRQPLTMAKALDVLSSVLKEKGYAAIRIGKTLKIVRLDQAKSANIPVHSGNDPAAVTESDQIITQVIPVRYADAAQLKTDLAPLIPAYASMSANVSTNTLILTDTAANVKRIMQIIRALDTAVSAVTQVRVFPLQYANASSAARLITAVFEPEPPPSQQRGTPVITRFGRFQQGGQGQQQNPEAGRPQTRVIASADDRTNTVVVSGPDDTMPLIEQVLHELDANPAQEQAVFIYYLRNAQAVNMETVLNNLFNGSTTTRTTTGTTSRGATQAQSRTGGMTLSQIGTGTRTATTTPTTAAARPGAAPQLSAAAAQAANDLTGQVSVVADADTNSLLVMTSSANFDRVRNIVNELDRPVPQVLIKVLVAEVTHNRTTDIGVEFSAINLKTSGDTTVFTDFGVEAATGGLIAKLVETDVTVAIRALEEVGKLDVLSRPYILASDNQEASIIVGQEVPIINSSRITDTGQTINTLIYQDVGIILHVTPHVNPDGLVVMDVVPEISALTGETVPISDNASQPVIAKRSAQTRVAIRDGQTIVIGGLMEDRKTQTLTKVPLLGDIPLVGLLFQRDEVRKDKTELLIFLTPHVAQQPDQLQGMSDDERAGVKIVPEAIEPGMFDEHYEGLQRAKSGRQAPETE